MINILTSPLPDFLTVDGENYPINTDFRVWISIEELLRSSSISDINKLIKVFSLAFVKKIPSNGGEALSQIMQFLSPVSKTHGKKASDNSPPLFDFSYDGGLIYAAFLSQYGIDLSVTQLHWWKFLSLFSSLSACKFTDILRVRGLDLSLISDLKQKSRLRQLKRIYRLPDIGSDMSSEIGKLIQKGG